MRITRENIEELNSELTDLLDLAGEVLENGETWSQAQDDPEMVDDRRDARDFLEENLAGLEDLLASTLKVLNPKRLAT